MAHLCPARRCSVECPDQKLMCPDHWRLVPRPLQVAVYTAYDHGRGMGSYALLAAQTDAITAANARLTRR